MQTTWPLLNRSIQKKKSGIMKMQRVEANRTCSLWLLVRNVNVIAQNKQEAI